MPTAVALELIATVAAGLFAGAAIYVSAIEHPARMSLPMSDALHEFRPSYRRGAVMQIFLSTVGGLAALAAGIVNSQTAWLAGGILLLLPIPYTLIFIMKTNTTLLDTSTNLSDADIRVLLHRWGAHHTVRMALGLIAFAWMLLQLLPLTASGPSV